MAETTTFPKPREANDSGYRRISGFAIAGLVVGIFFVLFLLVQAVMGLMAHATILLPLWFEFIAVLGVALSLIGARSIRRADGALAGMRIAAMRPVDFTGDRTGLWRLLRCDISCRTPTGRRLHGRLVRQDSQGQAQRSLSFYPAARRAPRRQPRRRTLPEHALQLRLSPAPREPPQKGACWIYSAATKSFSS